MKAAANVTLGIKKSLLNFNNLPFCRLLKIENLIKNSSLFVDFSIKDSFIVQVLYEIYNKLVWIPFCCLFFFLFSFLNQ